LAGADDAKGNTVGTERVGMAGGDPVRAKRSKGVELPFPSLTRYMVLDKIIG